MRFRRQEFKIIENLDFLTRAPTEQTFIEKSNRIGKDQILSHL